MFANRFNMAVENVVSSSPVDFGLAYYDFLNKRKALLLLCKLLKYVRVQHVDSADQI